MRTIKKAVKTMAAIDAAMTWDQGAAYRQNLQKILPHMSDAYRGEDEGFRSHLGASVIGGECSRAVWYGFRWATKSKFEARILRLFNRGHLEEARFIAALLTIGARVFQQDSEGKQFRISDVGGHFGGSGDGVAIEIPDLPEKTPCLLEFKTHNDKSFKKLVSEGVRDSKFAHYVQMNIYMRKMGLEFALYGAVNKNDDELYFEIVQLDHAVADQFLDRARKIITISKAPEKLNESPGWFACAWCDHKSVCHLKAAPAKNCRTCKFSEALEDGAWYCKKDNWQLSKAEQLSACAEYEAF